MSEQQTTLLDCEYFPCIAWYQQFLKGEQIMIEKHENFVRTSLRNRFYIAGPNGRMSLTVPLDGGRNQKKRVCDLKISSNEPWQILHWKTLQACYNRSPYFEFFKDELYHLFHQKYHYLIDLNLDTIQTMNKLLSIKKQFTLTSDYIKSYEPQVLDLRNRYNAEDAAWDGDIHYIQSFEKQHGFIKELSMLDLLLCCGKQSVELLIKH
jgi:WbqC-like protein family